MITSAFARTFARLLADRGRATASMLCCSGLVLAGWWWWAAHADVTLYEVSAHARVELDAATYPIDSPVAGRVLTTNLRVGRAVRKGQGLIEIDAIADGLRLRQEEMRARGLDAEGARLRAQIAAEERARAEEQHAARLSADEAANRIREAEAEERHAEDELTRMEALHRRELVPTREVEKARTDVLRLREAVTTLEASARRVPQEQTTRDRERDVRIERLHAQIAAVAAQRRMSAASVQRLEYEIDRRTVRAPVDGIIGEAAPLRPGAVVQQAQNLASIVPAGHLVVAAQFPADAALGRIRPGQGATLRLDGFPWAEFGAVSATVATVAREIREGTVRVELTIEPDSGFRGTLEHGMPGSAEVAVERVTPLSLLLRTAGEALTVRR
jgi:membrane fusion protein (multidrug efflux system)